MSGELIVSIASAAGTIGAVVVAVVALVRASASEKKAGVAQERATTAAERIASVQLAAFHQPPWKLEWFAGESYLLTNNSPIDAREVMIEGHAPDVDDAIQLGYDLPWEVGAMSAVKFMFAPSMGVQWQQDLIVRWKRAGSDDVLEWRHPFPSKPSRR